MASFTVPCPKVSPFAGFRASLRKDSPPNLLKQNLSFNLHGSSSKSSQLSGVQGPIRKQSAGLMVNAQLNEVANKSPNSAPDTSNEPINISPIEENISSRSVLPDPESISTFMSQVTDLIKLVDSRDIMELQLKQSDCEITIRKKEALIPPALAAPIYFPQAMYSPTPLPAPTASSAPTSPPAAPARALPALPKTSTSAHPPLKCPMAGTFYRCPGPGEPPFVKVGDKVQKGQVICIIEAMKLMNEIEADQSGTIAEILVEDGKPVSVDMPLFAIVP